MSKINGPLFSLTAAGTIAKALVYSSWRGVKYVRTHVVPANPNTTAQQEVRGIFRTLNAMWNRAPSIFREPWTANAAGNPYTNRNKLVALNSAPLKNQVSLANFVFSPGMGGAIPPVSITVTPGAGSLTVAVTAPTLPTGWTITAAQAVAILDGDPSPVLIRTPFAGEDLATPYSIVLSGLTTALHYVGAWLKWTAPDLSIRYSTAVTGSGTPT